MFLEFGPEDEDQDLIIDEDKELDGSADDDDETGIDDHPDDDDDAKDSPDDKKEDDKDDDDSSDDDSDDKSDDPDDDEPEAPYEILEDGRVMVGNQVFKNWGTFVNSHINLRTAYGRQGTELGKAKKGELPDDEQDEPDASQGELDMYSRI